MILLYRLAMLLLLPPAILILKFSDRLRGKMRPPWALRFMRGDSPVQEADLWIQAVSVGEVELAGHLVREILRKKPNFQILLTSTTATGLALAQKSLGKLCRIHPCPVDMPGPVGRLLYRAHPRLIVLIETELWPEMLHQAGRREIPVVVINARLSERSFNRYHRIRRALKSLLEPLSLVLARDQGDAERFRALGIPEERIRVGGNLKYDLRAADAPLDWAPDFLSAAGDRPVIVAGSTMEGEERILLDALKIGSLQKLKPLLILAPRHPERFEAVGDLVLKEGLQLTRRSLETPSPGIDVFLLDTIGELARAYQLGNLAFLGGSLAPTGGHNPLEALLWGVPVLSGPSMENFEEIYSRLLGAGAVIRVQSAEDLAEAATRWIIKKEEAKKAGQSGLEIIEKNRGATASTATEILSMLEETI